MSDQPDISKAVFTPTRSHAGYAYEEIGASSRKWGRSWSAPVVIREGFDSKSELHRQRRMLDSRDDVRDITAWWSPDGGRRRIQVSSYEEAMALHNATWAPLVPVPAEKPKPHYVIVGPFDDQQAANDWAFNWIGEGTKYIGIATKEDLNG